MKGHDTLDFSKSILRRKEGLGTVLKAAAVCWALRAGGAGGWRVGGSDRLSGAYIAGELSCSEGEKVEERGEAERGEGGGRRGRRSTCSRFMMSTKLTSPLCIFWHWFSSIAYRITVRISLTQSLYYNNIIDFIVTVIYTL